MPTFRDWFYICIISVILLVVHWRSKIGPRVYTCVVNYFINIRSDKNHKLSAKFRFASVAELHASIRATRGLSKDQIIIFRLSSTYTGMNEKGESNHVCRWMDLTNLSHPSEVPKTLAVDFTSPEGETLYQWQLIQICHQGWVPKLFWWCQLTLQLQWLPCWRWLHVQCSNFQKSYSTTLVWWFAHHSMPSCLKLCSSRTL